MACTWIRPFSSHLTPNARRYCCVGAHQAKHNCKVLIVGGGAGGCSLAARLARKLRPQDIIVLEPSLVHYYQPLFTLVSAGIKQFRECHRPQKSVLPNVRWVVDEAAGFDPRNNAVCTASGSVIEYEYMVVALGLVNDYEQIPGLKKALDNKSSHVSSIYSVQYCQKTWEDIKRFGGGHAVFCFPRNGSKCSGAALTIMYLAEDYWRQKKMRPITNMTYITGGDSIFGVPKYAHALQRFADNKGIAVNYNLQLLKLTKEGAVFQGCGCQTVVLPYNFIHVTPPMSVPVCLKNCTELTSDSGYLDVDIHTLRHTTYGNVFGVGDCLCTPNSKTAAAVAHQSSIVEENLYALMKGCQPSASYLGYGACPLLTSYKSGILAEYRYDRKPHETFPFDQSKERRIFYHVKTNLLPYIYWNKLLKGKWDGPGRVRKVINPLGK